MSDDPQTLHRRAVEFWGDDITAMMMEAVPGTPFFDEMRNALNRAQLDGLDPLLIGADIRGVCLRNGITLGGLAERLEVPYAYAYALDAGWQRLTTRGLVTVASRLEVPLAAFIRDSAFRQRERVRMYRAWRMIVRDGEVGTSKRVEL